MLADEYETSLWSPKIKPFVALSVSNVDLAVFPPAHDVVFLTIVCTFEICRASHVTKSSRYLSAKIIIFSDLELSVCALSSSQNKYRQF